MCTETLPVPLAAPRRLSTLALIGPALDAASYVIVMMLLPNCPEFVLLLLAGARSHLHQCATAGEFDQTTGERVVAAGNLACPLW